MFSGLALIFGIFSLKRVGQAENKSLAIVGIVLGGIGFVFSSIGIMIMQFVYPSLVSLMQDTGILDCTWPIYSLTISFALLIYAILTIKNIENIKKAIISLCSGFLLSVLLSLPHVLGLYPTPGSDIVNVLNMALPNLSIIFLLSVFSLFSTIFISKKSFFYMIISGVIVLLVILTKAYSSIGALIFLLIILLYSLSLIVVLYQNRELLKNIHKTYYIITAIISLLTIIVLITLVLLPHTESYVDFLYQHYILIVLLDGSMKRIILGCGAVGIILWIYGLIKIFKNETLIE